MLYLFFIIIVLIYGVKSQECNGILRAAVMELKSPGYPTMLRPGILCEWTVQSVSNNICKLEVEFIVADLHDASLIIAGVPHSGSVAGLRTYFFNNTTKISFRSGKSTGKGFNIIVKQKMCDDSPTTCGSVLDTKDIIINGPPPNSQVCALTIKQFTKDVCKIAIDFDTFFITSSKDCIIGGLEIGDDILCGNLNGHRKYDLVNGELKIKFHTDHISLRNKFSLKITQMICNSQPELSNKIEDFNVTKTDTKESFFNQLPSFNTYNYNYGACCNQIHSERLFYLTTPGFPNSNNVDCTYTIRRNNPDIQFLRINFKYFWIGEKDDYYNSCNGGFLQIDGYTFCGCQTGVSWVTPFSIFQFSEFKTFRLYINEPNRNRFTGFVIEVIQCQYTDPPLNRYIRQLGRITNKNMNSDYINNSKAKLSDPTNYVFENKNVTITENIRQDRHQTHESFIIPTDFYCLSWNLKDWVVLLQQALSAQLHCPKIVSNKLSKLALPQLLNRTAINKCTEIHDDHGTLQIPELNSDSEQDNKCLRFLPTAGKCILEVIFHGIDVPWSDKCNQSTINISGNGNICPVSDNKKVQVALKEEPIDIKIGKTQRKGTAVYLEFRQISCT